MKISCTLIFTLLYCKIIFNPFFLNLIICFHQHKVISCCLDPSDNILIRHMKS